MSTPRYPPGHPLEYRSDIFDAEPLHRYRKGGYHPVHLGDRLSNGRYKILHKLGWGGYSTVWAAYDDRENMYVAIKVSVAESDYQSQEAAVLHGIEAENSHHPGHQHLMKMHDQFETDGPNGTHDCLVLELLGPSVANILNPFSGIKRLPGPVAKRVAKQALLGLSFLHEHGFAHGDVYPGNLAFTIPSIHDLREEDFLRTLGKPETGLVRRSDHQPLEIGVPRYIVSPTSYPVDFKSLSASIKIVDYGQSFLSGASPNALKTPVPFRAPEIEFKDSLDHRVDLWSMGCVATNDPDQLFDLIAGQAPFDNCLWGSGDLVQQMLEMLSDNLPDRWQSAWHIMKQNIPSGDASPPLQSWLEELYFDKERKQDMGREDIARVGELIASMLRLEPSNRPSARKILQHSWFEDFQAKRLENFV